MCASRIYADTGSSAVATGGLCTRSLFCQPWLKGYGGATGFTIGPYCSRRVLAAPLISQLFVVVSTLDSLTLICVSGEV